MRTLLTALRHAPKRASALIAMIAAVLIVPAALLAWGPDRPTYTIAHPADHITFNSITDNPNIGDERNFVGIRENGTTGQWQDTQTVQAGKEYVVRMYVHNNAASNLNLVAENVTAKFNLPTNTAKSIQVNGFLDSSNATPTEVYDHATFTGAQDFNLAYVPGTLKFYNNFFGSNGTPISETAFTSAGAKLGYDKLDGKIPGCFQYAGYLTFIVKPQVAQTGNFTVSKQVRKSGTTAWQKSVAVNPGDSVDYLIDYTNVGTAQQNNVVLKDSLPTGTSYTAGTTYLVNTTNPNGLKVDDSITTANGMNIGNYTGNAGAYVKFSAKVADNSHLPACGANTLTNTIRVETDFGYKTDTANVTVNKTCVQPKQIQVCELATGKIVTINESDFNSSKQSKNLNDCAPKPGMINVCDMTTKQVISIKTTDFDSKKYSKNVADCVTTPTTPVTPTTPTELPHTGPAETVMSIVGLGSLIAASAYYIASRRALS